MKRIIAIFIMVCTFVGISALPASATSRSQVLSGLQAISSDFSSIQQAAKARSMSRLSSACEDMGYHAEMILDMTRPKSVPSTSWVHLMLAMGYYVSAADDCVYGADNYDTDSLQSSIASMNIAVKEVNKARKTL